MLSLKLMVLILTFLSISDCQKSGKGKKKVMNNTCGEERDTNARLFRGDVAPKNRFPYYIQLIIHFEWDTGEYIPSMKHRCAGVLISKKHILTNAHCFFL